MAKNRRAPWPNYLFCLMGQNFYGEKTCLLPHGRKPIIMLHGSLLCSAMAFKNNGEKTAQKMAKPAIFFLFMAGNINNPCLMGTYNKLSLPHGKIYSINVALHGVSLRT